MTKILKKVNIFVKKLNNCNKIKSILFAKKVHRIVSEEEDSYGLYEMLLNVAEDSALLDKRTILIEKLFSVAVNKLNSAQTIALCNPENFILFIIAQIFIFLLHLKFIQNI